MRDKALLDSRGRAIWLGKEIGAGGEGTVYEVAGNRRFVAKIYKQQVPRDKVDKLCAMARAATPDLIQIAAWPVDVLRNADNQSIAGVLLPRVDGAREIHELYSPAHRRSSFSGADWRQLVHAARNLACAFGHLHSRGVVVGDVNQGNVLVDHQMVVRFIDCDSFQIVLNGIPIPCEVGVPHFTPPELQGASFRSVTRTPNHDAFGLAVLIFHLLFMGRHPFAGQFHGAGQMPIERAIQELRFAYGGDPGVTQMTPPPHALPMSAVPVGISSLFARAFSRGSVDVAARPAAIEWVNELDRMASQLITCQEDPGHRHLNVSSGCPWCQLMAAGAPNFFVSVTLHVSAAGARPRDIFTIWARIQGVSRPIEEVSYYVAQRNLPKAVGKRLPDIDEREDLPARLVQTLAFAFGGLSLLGILFPIALFALGLLSFAFGAWRLVTIFNSPLRQIERRRRKTRTTKLLLLKNAEHEFQRGLGSYRRQFDSEIAELIRLRGAHDALEARKQADIAVLKQDAANRQLDDYLRNQFISAHRHAIPYIGPGRLATLESYGIETALDVSRNRIQSIHGFGEAITDALLEWRRGVESRFRFDPRKGIPQADLQNLEIKYFREKEQIEQSMESGCERLEKVSQAASAQAAAWEPEYWRLVTDVQQATADLEVCRNHQRRSTEPWWIAATAFGIPIIAALIQRLCA